MIPTVIAPHTPVAHGGNPQTLVRPWRLPAGVDSLAAGAMRGIVSPQELTALAPLNSLRLRGGETKRSFGRVG